MDFSGRRLLVIGGHSRSYVEKWHDPLKIAARLKTEYQEIMTSKTGRCAP